MKKKYIHIEQLLELAEFAPAIRSSNSANSNVKYFSLPRGKLKELGGFYFPNSNENSHWNISGKIICKGNPMQVKKLNFAEFAIFKDNQNCYFIHFD